jgi:hypothetical protein
MCLKLADISGSPDQRFIRFMGGTSQGLINSKPCPENPAPRMPPETKEKILYLRNTYRESYVIPTLQSKLFIHKKDVSVTVNENF